MSTNRISEDLLALYCDGENSPLYNHHEFSIPAIADITAMAIELRDRRAADSRANQAGTVPEADSPTVVIGYTNWRGEYAEREIVPMWPWFGSTDWHPEEQWLLKAWDVAKDAERDFAVKDIGFNGALSGANQAVVTEEMVKYLEGQNQNTQSGGIYNRDLRAALSRANQAVVTEEVRQAAIDVDLWLKSALECQEWVWDGDQRAAAEDARAALTAALSRAEGQEK